MKLSDFNFNLPKTQIAKFPVEPRDSAKLLVLDREHQTIESKVFSDVIDYMEKGDVLVVNETKVIQARLYGKKERTNAKIEVFLLRELNKEECIWDVIVDPARKVRIGNRIYFNDKLWCEVIDNTTSRGRTVRFNQPGNVFKAVEKIGLTPLPPYIKRDPVPEDKENYQTVYAKVDGAVAAPTAGLHFTEELLDKIKKKGIKIAPVVLHIGLGTFRPVEVEDLTKHKMDSEYFEISTQSADTINKAIQNKHRVFVTGTSSTRALESSVTAEGFVKPNHGWTDKFIFPPYDFKIVQRLITNFHAPESTLIMLASAFAGYDLLMKAYKKALKENYRFLSYGDAMLII
ncbi:MAG: tRNA preQ1(34) S-adenosylmethionine ribosyltransferase-isomerase QueA [Bacteroidota bacterium]|jgi:S-adenosylmethionine:tRNA ribosyltransferase-isomerase|nr:tRNA preQ1(34) S-adenosylmethionine ribosyltransferase-isomerase QueA [Ignavibacteria bacterium]MCU7498607.1 tRNA preQ1(34) S-adenosylmethionine ribosyltransferase-isomerase QueA [Ignavibacteria bacterium]MCU7512489.1 tRNA preQ1(34) S-adenosylmethionine ribosyltransferase-isomerase QueA [Ignavibacteria bacterium]MCU7520914.1 tRNA preQ1(34) S-adenosylmethionine ribosyltransferase-isomerase QueA [Ignavibacteria bacterium]MCU7523592.1 tRNA preQ1(34) S-adenosylmethionine ribosyltransferase-isome